MAKFKMDDGTVLNTDKATQEWTEDTRWNGNNHISVNTGSQWEHQTLFKSAKGRYYLVHSSAYQGSLSHAELISNEEAAGWLLTNREDLPEDLKQYQESIEE